MRYIALSALCLSLALGGCGFNDWANTHMPVIGQRCENWQCFTESGREQSKLNEQAREHASSSVNATEGVRLPANTGAAQMPGGNPVSVPPAAPATPLAPPAEEGAYKYVPRAPLPAGATPFDGQITPIQ